MAQACKLPVDVNHTTTCVDVRFSSLCGYNFDNYMVSWTDHGRVGTLENDRLPIFATLEGNVNVTTAWLDFGNITLDSERFQRIG
jgi:hypothetical protein